MIHLELNTKTGSPYNHPPDGLSWSSKYVKRKERGSRETEGFQGGSHEADENKSDCVSVEGIARVRREGTEHSFLAYLLKHQPVIPLLGL